ncbi:MAG TPA: 8-oxoguanine deaminase [Acidimicrobiia bacterium]|nr:8-oxoguanine deaminase [Acidimicrobiia bacterium]
MGTLLARHALVLVTMDGAEFEDGALYARDGWIEAVGPSSDLPDTAEEVVDLTGHVVLPGLVNSHHHLYQTLTRVVPGAQDAGLFQWLRTLYPIWERMTPDHIRVATTVGLAELALSGCTTAFDHQYLWPNGSKVDDQIEGAAPVGIRFHVSRGSMSLGESDGGLPPDSIVETPQAILEDSARAVATFHQPDRGAMTRVVLAPCSPFSVTNDLMRETTRLARDLDVTLHTHLAETADEEEFCIARFDRRPVEHMEDLGWAGSDVWYAHAIHVAPDEITRMGEAGTGVAHCPTSNMRLASGLAPVAGYLDAGVRVGLGVDGSASNDSSNLLGEVRQTLLLNRLSVAPGVGAGEQMTARDALRLATSGGASVLGRDDIGRLAPGMAADFVAIDFDRLEFAGAIHDPVAAVVMCSPLGVDHSWVGGQRVVEDRQLVGLEVGDLVAEHNRLARALLG